MCLILTIRLSAILSTRFIDNERSFAIHFRKILTVFSSNVMIA